MANRGSRLRHHDRPVEPAESGHKSNNLRAVGLYLITDEERLAWVTVADLGVVVLLGLIMAARWVGVYRAYGAPDSSPSKVITVPPERHFPRSVVAIHGILAASAVALVVLSVLFDGS
jgi:hypothetical protein